MKTVAIIAEFNPFHNGHKYIVNQAKKITNSDYCISIMSGNFLQRGIPSMWDKYTRATIAVQEGIDLCLELPFPYATGSAYDFAMGAVSILNSLNSVDYLCFGAETDDLALFERITEILINEPDEYKTQLKTYLSQGLSFPSARSNALVSILQDTSISDLLSKPNNILALEYIHSLKKINSPIKPIIIKRVIANYHDNNLRPSISSATSIRNQFNENICNDNISAIFPKKIRNVVPKNTIDLLSNVHSKKGPIFNDDLTPYIQGKIINTFDYSNICDFTNELNNKLSKNVYLKSYNDLISSLKTKDITAARISRALLHMILNYKSSHRDIFLQDEYSYYASILAFQKNSSALLKQLTSNSDIPVITKKADFNNYIKNYPNINFDNANLMWSFDIAATNLFNCLIFNRYKYINHNDFTQQLPII